MNSRDRKTVRRILKVNHAGEYGAVRIYRAQLWLARRWYPSLVEFLEETLSHEKRHCQLFFAEMPVRNTRPCRVMSLWGNGGYILGFATALLGSQSIWICTSAVEETVHRHLEEQLKFLSGKDDQLAALIGSIKVEELHHLEYANSKIVAKGGWANLLRVTIIGATELLIGLSTWGDSFMMAREVSHSSQK